MIGRFQPFHKGHEALIQTLLDEGKNVLIACRLSDGSINNPYSYNQRYDMIRSIFPNKDRIKIILLPDIEEVVYGRKVGWGIRKIKLSAELESISATKIREKL